MVKSERLINLEIITQLEMYKLPGVRSDAWLTENEKDYTETCGPLKGFRNYGLWSVGDEYTDLRWEKTKKEIRNYLKNDLKTTKQDFQKTWKCTVTASRKARKYLKRNFEKNPGYAVGLVLEGLGWAAKYCGIEGLEGIGDGLIVGGLVPIGSQLIYNVRGKDRKKALEVQKEIRDLLKELVKTPINGGSDYKEGLEILLDRFEKGKIEPKQIKQIRKEQIEPVRQMVENCQHSMGLSMSVDVD